MAKYSDSIKGLIEAAKEEYPGIEWFITADYRRDGHNLVAKCCYTENKTSYFIDAYLFGEITDFGERLIFYVREMAAELGRQIYKQPVKAASPYIKTDFFKEYPLTSAGEYAIKGREATLIAFDEFNDPLAEYDTSPPVEKIKVKKPSLEGLDDAGIF